MLRTNLFTSFEDPDSVDLNQLGASREYLPDSPGTSRVINTSNPASALLNYMLEAHSPLVSFLIVHGTNNHGSG